MNNNLNKDIEDEDPFVDCDKIMAHFGRQSIHEYNGGREYKGDMYYSLCEESQQALIDLLGLENGIKPEVAYIPNGQICKEGYKIISKDGRYGLLAIDDDFKIKAIMNNKGGYTFKSNRGKTFGWDTDGNFTIYVKKSKTK